MLALYLIASTSAAKMAGIVTAAIAATGAVVGLFFRGAAMAWRDERDAAIDKAERLAEKVAEQAGQIKALERKVAVLEKRTDYEGYAQRSADEHRQILDALRELARGVHANTVAVEFLVKQAFPAAVFPAGADTAV